MNRNHVVAHTFKLDGFTNRKSEPVSYSFSLLPSATYKWGVFAAESSRHDVFRSYAWAKTSKQAREYAKRHGFKTYAVGRVS